MDLLGAATREKKHHELGALRGSNMPLERRMQRASGAAGEKSLPEGVAGTAEGPHGVAAGGFRAAAGEGDGGGREEAAKTLAGRLAFGANGEEL